ncbi:uncharacterized protein HD556DRAFT_1302646 [Suillus plorans]|uniref:Uncharacterized protein n=1 Tax=Suillus plorans TaxID=116603 RepID=A0A9P7J9M5_9AGAM|nr:uncharacterized protein HD556DRAFT_1302646 [Suillus plorans]KAG1810316.1 hypothetical protein HD556DRAFT_1302646 [Suillus plorans]
MYSKNANFIINISKQILHSAKLQNRRCFEVKRATSRPLIHSAMILPRITLRERGRWDDLVLVNLLAIGQYQNTAAAGISHRVNMVSFFRRGLLAAQEDMPSQKLLNSDKAMYGHAYGIRAARYISCRPSVMYENASRCSVESLKSMHQEDDENVFNCNHPLTKRAFEAASSSAYDCPAGVGMRAQEERRGAVDEEVGTGTEGGGTAGGVETGTHWVSRPKYEVTHPLSETWLQHHQRRNILASY